jgi:phosphatidylinositol kinase/protein kinase (PI-3  family)
VFREEEDTISTFLDVLKYDPLYNWYALSSFFFQHSLTMFVKDDFALEEVGYATRDAR